MPFGKRRVHAQLASPPKQPLYILARAVYEPTRVPRTERQDFRVFLLYCLII